MSALVFATSFIDSNPDRYQGWIDYYTEFFYGMDVDLAIINDGPSNTNLDLKDVEQVILNPHLGRKHVWIFPGWKRSFCHGIKMSISRRIKYVAHIESDCFIKLSGRQEFLDHLFKPGYYVPFCKAYNFPETALQILNEDWIKSYFVDRYSVEENLHEELDFEKMVKEDLKPVSILDGDRYEGKIERMKEKYNFISGCTSSEFMKLTAGGL